MGVEPAFPHEHFRAGGDDEPDPTPQPYRIDVLFGRVNEKEALALAGAIADLLVEHGFGLRTGDDRVRAMLGVSRCDWPASFEQALGGELASALHVLVPKAEPRTPDLGADYSPN
jgi:hypothetical protein